MSDVPEVVFLGRSNVGKSSLLNAIMEKGLCFTSSKVGRTRTLNAYGIGGRKDGEAKVVLVDTPGYGKGSHEEWGEVIMKYLTKRRQCVIPLRMPIKYTYKYICIQHKALPLLTKI